ncbi:hypothetical protein [uncultured Desulfosarcina sp.]|uniref:hypothetical protein n=1 Tax=uncultured Desulfosarcina sp. TaxID=218289 RepID=UPI0029C669F9|nr:hypothetical protein [uncultured Desulfosarcina sp.]
MDFEAKKQELETLWEDSFDLCKTMVASCKNGDMKLTGSILKELNQFIKQSVDFIHHTAAQEAFSDQQRQDEEDAMKAMEELDVSLPVFPEDDEDEHGEALELPEEFPCIHSGD